MKSYIFYLFLLVSVIAKGQETIPGQFIKPNNSRGITYNGIEALQEFYLPLADTNYTPKRAGAILVKSSNKKTYQYNGTAWAELQGTGGSANGVDSTRFKDSIAALRNVRIYFKTPIGSGLTATKEGVADTVVLSIDPAKTTTAVFSGSSTALRSGDVYYGMLDPYTGETVNTVKVTGKTDADVDNVIYFKKGVEYFKRVFEDEINVLWFSAYKSGSDWQPAFQKAADVAIANDIHGLYAPHGSYQFNSPLILYKWNGTNYTFFTINFRGDAAAWGANGGTIINCNFNNAFALGIQLGKSCTVSGIDFEGRFTPPTYSSTQAFYHASFASFTDGASLDNQFAAYGAVIIDPFKNNTSLPSGGGYPTLTSWYRGDGTQNTSGCTGITVRDCKVRNFVLGIALSINGQTQNAEIIKLINNQFENVKLAVSGGQDQEKANVIDGIYDWGGSHTLFATGLYGAGTAGNWNVNNVNIAGGVVRMIYNIAGGYYPTYITNVFAESLGSFGSMQSTLTSTVQNGVIDFAGLPEAGYGVTIDATGVLFKDIPMRYYDNQKHPLVINGISTYEHCGFDVAPVGGQSKFIDCNNGKLGTTNTVNVNRGDLGAADYYSYGSYTLSSIDNADTRIKQLLHVNNSDLYAQFTTTGTIGTITSNTATWTTTWEAARVGTLLKIGTGYGTITAVSSGVATISYLSQDVTAGSNAITAYYPLYMAGTFIGDITTGSSNITNVKIGWGNHDPSTWVGKAIKNPYARYNSFYEYALITGYSSGTFTCYSQGSFFTTTGAYFSNGSTQEIVGGSLASDPMSIVPEAIVQKGDRIIFGQYADNNYDYTVTKSGFLNPSAVGDTRQATWATTGTVTAGSNKQLIYSNSGTITGAANVNFDNVNNRVGINTTTPTARLEINEINATDTIAKFVGQNKTVSISPIGNLIVSGINPLIYAQGTGVTGFLMDKTSAGGSFWGIEQRNVLGDFEITNYIDNSSPRFSIKPDGFIKIGTTPTTSAGSYVFLTYDTTTHKVEKVSGSNKLNISDTSSMLSPYALKSQVGISSNWQEIQLNEPVSLTIPSDNSHFRILINPASTASAITVTLPAGIVGQEVRIIPGGYITTGIVCSSLTLSNTIEGSVTITDFSINDSAHYIYTSTGKWCRIDQ